MAAHTLKDPKASQQALDELIEKHAGSPPIRSPRSMHGAGEKDQAFAWLERAYAQRDDSLTTVKYDSAAGLTARRSALRGRSVASHPIEDDNAKETVQYILDTFVRVILD